MTITRKFWMLSVAGILTTGVASALVGSNLNDIARHWKEKTTITERLNRAAYEMEINVNGAGMAVMKYLLTRDPRNIERFDKDVSNFRQFWAEFSQTASDTESQGLAKRARESFDAYTDLGTSLIALTDTRRNLLDSIIKDMSELDDSINRYQDLLREAPEKMALFLAMEADLAQTFARLMLYLSDQDSGNRRAVHDYLERFSKQVGEFTSGARTEGEKRSAEGLASIWKSLSGTVVKAMNGSDLSRSSLERLIQLRRQLDDILDEEVQKLTSNRDSIADAQIGSAISKGVVELAVASIFITIFLVIGLLIFYRDVISPLGTVTAAAEQLTRENFEHRVPIAAPNEMGKVGVALNVMAERLGRVIGELHKSRAFLEERVKEQTDDLLRVNQSLQQEIATCKRIHQELSDQKKLMADILDNMDDSIVVFDREMRITAFNPSYQRRFFSGTPLIGRTCRAVCTEFPHRCTECPAETTLAEMRPVHKLESRLRAEDPGRAVEWFDVRTSLLTDEREGEIRGVIESRRDVSDHVSLEVQLRHAQKMEAVGTLAGGIAHDFNNRLQVVIGYTDLLLLNKKPMDREYERLYAIRKVAMDGAELVKSLLAFSRKIEPAIRVLNLNKEIERVRRMLERVVSKAIRIKTRLAYDLMNVKADPGHLEQILINLAVNAQHAMPDGGLLTIETANATLDEDFSRANPDLKPGKYAVLTITDTGHGMDNEVLERIFEPFYTTKNTGEGTGLGLAIVHGMVKIHGGHITCESKVGVGSTFNIYLPAVEEEIEPDISVTREMPAFGTETILVVDDEESVRDMSSEILAMRGYTVLKAANGREALEVYRSMQDKIALVFLDLVMPEMGGKECLEELLKINPKVRVVIASGYGSDAWENGILEAATIGFLKKPYDAIKMLQVARQILDA